MFTESGLRTIKDFSANDPVISLYLNTEPSQGNAETHRLRLRNMLKDIYLEEDVKALENFFNYTYDWSGRSVAVFSCAPARFFKAIPLAIPIRDFIQIGSRAAIEPLEDLLQEYSSLGVILVDKEGGRLLEFNMGELIEDHELRGEHVRQVKSGEAPQTHRFRGGALISSRTVDETIDRNLREVAAAAIKFFESRHIRRIMIGGTDENVSRFRSFLPKSMQSLIVKTFAVNKNSKPSEVLQRIMKSVETE